MPKAQSKSELATRLPAQLISAFITCLRFKCSSRLFLPEFSPPFPCRRSPPTAAELQFLHYLTHLLHLFPLDHNLAPEIYNSSLTIWIGAKCLRTLETKSEITFSNSGIKALEVRVVTPLTKLYIMATRTNQNAEEKRKVFTRDDAGTHVWCSKSLNPSSLCLKILLLLLFILFLCVS